MITSLPLAFSIPNGNSIERSRTLVRECQTIGTPRRSKARWTKVFGALTFLCLLGALVLPIGGMCAGPGMLFVLAGIPMLALTLVAALVEFIESRRDPELSANETAATE